MPEFSIFYAIATLAFVGCSRGENIQMDQSCQGTYCTVPPKNYDTYIRNEIIEQSKYWAGKGATINEPDSIVPADANNCGSFSTVIQPFTISVKVNKTNQSVNKLVIQTEFFKQTIRVTNCLDNEMSCFDDIKMAQDDIKTYCDETYTDITLYVYEDNEIQPQSFPVPVSCACKVQFISMKK